MKALHVGAVCVSIGLFALRGVLRLAGSAWLQHRWLRIGPHVVDTLLLVSAIALTTVVHQYPFVDGWLTAKVLGLVAYVALGSIALRRGRTSTVRAAALVAALVVVAYIVGTALHHDPDPLRW
ncbi:MAG: SirB2 family protein [Proteobacteria bacterium]|nr:SirB2 family protein [Pseudomonadota bacterium]